MKNFFLLLIFTITFVSSFAQIKRDTTEITPTDSATFVANITRLRNSFDIITNYKFAEHSGAHSVGKTNSKDRDYVINSVNVMNQMLGDTTRSTNPMAAFNKTRSATGINMPPPVNVFNTNGIEVQAENEAEKYEAEIKSFGNSHACALYYLKLCKQYWGSSWEFRVKALKLTYLTVQKNCK